MHLLAAILQRLGRYNFNSQPSPCAEQAVSLEDPVFIIISDVMGQLDSVA